MISTFTAFFDANVFFGARLRSLVVELAKTGLFRARWSDQVHQEWMRSVVKSRNDIKIEALLRTRAAMDRAVPDCLVSGFEPVIDTLVLNDPDDRHVLAAAIVARASVIVTFNLKDFPEETLNQFGIHSVHPDDFLMEFESLQRGALISAIHSDWKHYARPPLELDRYCSDLSKAGVPQTAEYVRKLKVHLEAMGVQPSSSDHSGDSLSGVTATAARGANKLERRETGELT
jgi:predicted nucleic acid-binding protein